MLEQQEIGIRELLDQHGAQSRIADHVGCARAVAHRWVRGLATPSGPSLVALTDYLRRYVPSTTEREVLEELERRRAARTATNGCTPETHS